CSAGREQPQAFVPNHHRNGSPIVAGTGRDYGCDGSWKVVWARFCRLGEKNFWNFSLRALARFTKPTKAANCSARNRYWKRHLVWSNAGSAARLGRNLSGSTRGSRRDDDRHPTANWQPRKTRRAAFSILPSDTFSAQQTHFGRGARARPRNQRSPRCSRTDAENPGDFCIYLVVRLRSDPYQMEHEATCLAGASGGMARDR